MGSPTDIPLDTNAQSPKAQEAGVPSTPPDQNTSNVANSDEEEPVLENASPSPPPLSNTRLYFIGVGIWISLFLAAFEGTAVATSLLDITNEFNDFNRASWIVVGYLLTYNGFLLLSSKLCDILGIKSMFLLANFIFCAFSMGCGAAQSMNQLIILRAFQGIGGGGIYCISFILMMSIITQDKLAVFTGGISSVFAIASICGPLLGGVITQKSTWRWIFYLNGPGVAVAFAILWFALPDVGKVRLDKQTVSRIDFGGGFLSVAWSILLVFALQEGGADYPWNHPVIIGTFVSAVVGLALFAGYEAYIVKRSSVIEPIFPLRLLKHPAFTFMILTTFCFGVPIYTTIITIPQRFQIVNDETPIRAGLLLLPMLVTSPVVSLLPGIFLKTHFKYIPFGFAIGGVFTVVGSAGLSTLSDGTSIEPKTYAFLVLLGVGLGLIMPTSVMLVKFLVSRSDEAVALGAQNMTRVLGGLVGLAIATAILHDRAKVELHGLLNEEQLEALLKSTLALRAMPPEVAGAVKAAYGRSYNRVFVMCAGFSATTLIFGCLTVWSMREQIKAMTVQDVFDRMGASQPQPPEKKEEGQVSDAKSSTAVV